jgi:hypothetical protein
MESRLMIVALLGWFVLIIIALVFGVMAFYFLALGAAFDKSMIIGTVIFGLLCGAFCWAAYANTPFEVTMRLVAG